MKHVAFLLCQRFSNHCLANALEPLRAVNETQNQPTFSWEILTLDGGPVLSSSQLEITPNGALKNARSGSLLCVLPSFDPQQHATMDMIATLRRTMSKFEIVAGLDTGSWLLASTGLLDDRKATIHEMEIGNFSESFPNVDVQRARILKDGKYWTCGGAAAAFDLMTTFIQSVHGPSIAMDISAYFLMDARKAADLEKPSGSRLVDAACGVMRENIEKPISIAAIARNLRSHPKKLEREFNRALMRSPKAEYIRLRLSTAISLIKGSNAPITDIAHKCGYSDAAAFTRAFKGVFGVPPSHFRR